MTQEKPRALVLAVPTSSPGGHIVIVTPVDPTLQPEAHYRIVHPLRTQHWQEAARFTPGYLPLWQAARRGTIHSTMIEMRDEREYVTRERSLALRAMKVHERSLDLAAGAAAPAAFPRADHRSVLHHGYETPEQLIQILTDVKQDLPGTTAALSPYGHARGRRTGTSKPKPTAAATTTPTTAPALKPFPIPQSSIDQYPQATTLHGRAAVEAVPGKPYLLRGYANLGRDGKADVEVMRQHRAYRKSILLKGAPGTGKTQSVLAAFGTSQVFTIPGTEDTEVSDFIGGWHPKPGGGWYWKDGYLVRAMTGGCILLVDEIGLVSSKTLAVLYSVMDGRDELEVTANPERGTVRAEDGFYVVATTNPDAPGVRLSEALLSRFPVQPVVTTDFALARAMGVDGRLVTAAENLQKQADNQDIEWAPQMRELLDARDATAIMGERFALSALIGNAPDSAQPIVGEVLSRTFGFTVAALRTA